MDGFGPSCWLGVVKPTGASHLISLTRSAINCLVVRWVRLANRGRRNPRCRFQLSVVAMKNRTLLLGLYLGLALVSQSCEEENQRPHEPPPAATQPAPPANPTSPAVPRPLSLKDQYVQILDVNIQRAQKWTGLQDQMLAQNAIDPNSTESAALRNQLCAFRLEFIQAFQALAAFRLNHHEEIETLVGSDPELARLEAKAVSVVGQVTKRVDDLEQPGSSAHSWENQGGRMKMNETKEALQHQVDALNRQYIAVMKTTPKDQIRNSD